MHEDTLELQSQLEEAGILGENQSEDGFGDEELKKKGIVKNVKKNISKIFKKTMSRIKKNKTKKNIEINSSQQLEEEDVDNQEQDEFYFSES